MMLDLDAVQREAEEQLKQERFRAAVEEKKAQLRAHRSLWARLFPWTITITRKT